MGLRDLWADVRRAHVRGVVFRLYVLINAFIFHIFGRVIRYPLSRHRTESVQTVSGIRRVLQVTGFSCIQIRKDRHLTVEALLSPR
jgi:hypothetical protein